MRKEIKSILIILSVLALLNVMFVPIFDVWGKLIPDDVDRHSFDVIDIVFNDSDGWSYGIAQLTMSIFIPNLFMFIMSLCGSRGLYITSNNIGIIIWFQQVIDYGLEDDEFSDMFDIDDNIILIGTWIAIIIFIISFFIALSSKKKTESAVHFMWTNTIYNIPNNNKDPPIASVIFCSKCEAETKEDITFCGGGSCKL